MSTVFIIGAGTFFGQQLCQRFFQAGWKVLACSRQPLPPNLKALGIPWIQASFHASADSSLRPALKAVSDAEAVIYAGGWQNADAGYAKLYEEHVVRTASILNFCRYLPRLRHYYQTSTTRVAGCYSGLFQEHSNIPIQTYQDSWANALFAAEKLVLQTSAPFAKSVVRLGEVIGSTQTGEFPRVSGLYHILRALCRLKRARVPLRSMTFLPFVFSESTRLPLIPVDHAADAYQQLVKVGYQETGKTFHLLGGRCGISARKVLAEMMSYLDLDMEPLALPYHSVPKILWKYLDMPLDMLATLNSPTQFHSTILETTLPDLEFPLYKDYAPTLFAYAEAKIFSGGAS